MQFRVPVQQGTYITKGNCFYWHQQLGETLSTPSKGKVGSTSLKRLMTTLPLIFKSTIGRYIAASRVSLWVYVDKSHVHIVEFKIPVFVPKSLTVARRFILRALHH